jgi:hypothetical protein
VCHTRALCKRSDAHTTSQTSAPAETIYEGESATLSGGAKSVSCSACSTGKAAGYIGGTNNGAVTFSNIQLSAATRTTIRIKYQNGDKSQRFADISVNGAAAQRIAFLPASGDPGSSSINVDLKAGANEVKIAGIGGGAWGPDVDRLMVPKV